MTQIFTQITLMNAQINADWKIISAMICGFFREISEKRILNNTKGLMRIGELADSVIS